MTISTTVDWQHLARIVLTSRIIDEVEEKQLVPKKLVTYQFSSRGHELAQALVGLATNHPHDGSTVYYRSRPFMLTQGLTIAESFGASMAKVDTPSEGRDIGVVFNLPSRGKSTVLPMSGDVGTQFSPAVGWANAIRYRQEQLNEDNWNNAVAVVFAGDAACATGGFWGSINVAAVENLPIVFLVEDNGYGISVPSTVQTPGGNVQANLKSFQNLTHFEADGSNPEEAAEAVTASFAHARKSGPVLLRLRVPRLCGHSIADNQAYKTESELEKEWASDPLPRLKEYLIKKEVFTSETWENLEKEVKAEVDQGLEQAMVGGQPNQQEVAKYAFSVAGEPQTIGGVVAEGIELPQGNQECNESGQRINLGVSVRLTLEEELKQNSRVMVFGEDVGKKGGVHAVTLGLQTTFQSSRVFDTSLNEETIIGRAIGLSLAGLVPVPEIQFRKYADPAMEQLHDIGTIRWRTANKFGAPIVVRIPVGFSRRSGDPWHSVSDEVIFAHLPGWHIAFPSDAAEAAGLLRTALRGNDPVIFFEHRALLDSPDARKPYPGNEYMIPFGKARHLSVGDSLTIVSWGDLVHGSLAAAAKFPGKVEVIDLRTLSPWDEEAVLASVRKTHRLLVVHEDSRIAGFGAEIVATVTQKAFTALDAPPNRIATPNIPIPYNRGLMEAVIPSVAEIENTISEILSW